MRYYKTFLSFDYYLYIREFQIKNIKNVECVSMIELKYTQKLFILTHPTKPSISDNLFFGVL